MVAEDRARTISIGVLLLATLSAGCVSALEDPDAWPPSQEPPDMQRPPASASVPPTYLAWCRHYCEQLEATAVYSCVGAGEATSLAPCQEEWAMLADQCYATRCASGSVTPFICFAQCDSLNTFYTATCGGTETPQEPLCPATPAEADARCRVGCPTDQ